MSARWREAPVTGGAYSDETRAWTVQDTVNWIPEAAERGGGRSSSMLRCAPGAAVFCVPEAANPAPVRGLHDVEDKLFAVIGTKLWQITTAGWPSLAGPSQALSVSAWRTTRLPEGTS